MEEEYDGSVVKGYGPGLRKQLEGYAYEIPYTLDMFKELLRKHFTPVGTKQLKKSKRKPKKVQKSLRYR